MKLDNRDDVVISGVGGYFAKSSNMEAFKSLLFSNETLLETRWKTGERGVSNVIGKLPSIEYFDTAYFGIHRQQCIYMDPMQRLVLERTFEALIDAGVNPVDIRGKRVGVYMGSSVGENDNLFYESIVSGFGVTGHSRSMMPNRVSYWLNLKGPSCDYDSSWINGAEVMRIAYDAIRQGHIESAIIGTANLALNSELSWLFNDMGLLSADGATKAFDVDASGYARSDGVVIMYLQRACDAKRAYASVLNASTRFNGDRDGRLLDVDAPSMIRFMKEFYDECGVDPKEVKFVEAYGSALKNVDETELQAIEEIYCKNRNKPLMIGSVKSNAGHAEASAALVSVAKVLIAMETDTIPANIDFSKPNPNIPALANGKMEVVTENKKWEGGLAAVNCLGLASSYGHILLKSNPRAKVELKDSIPRLVVASTRTEEGIQKILETIKSQEKVDPEYISLIQDLFSKTIPGHLYRGYAVLDKENEIKQEFEYYPGNKRQIWFVYSGMGSQWCGMANDLMNLPMFAESIMRSHRILEKKGIDLLKIITDNDPAIFDNILHSFVGIAAVQIALTDILYALGIVPDGIVGHSVGELGCAYGDGCLSAEQMIMCAYSRGKASLEATLIKGMMAAIGMGYEQMKDKVPPTIEIACHNGPDSCTISGPTEDMEVFVKELQEKGIFARLVNVANIAYHSRYIKPAAPLLLKYLKEVIPNSTKRSSKWISSSAPEDQWETEAAQYSSAEYHTNNLLGSVLFEEASTHIPKDSIVIEIAPHGLLQAILKRSLKPGCTNVPLTLRGNKNGLQFLLTALGKLFLAGLDMNLTSLYPPIEYPVGRGTPGLAPLVHWEHSEKWRTGFEDKLNYLVSVKDIQVTLNSEEFREYVAHQLDNKIILPASAYLILILRILNSNSPEEITNVVFENLKFKNIITIPKIGSVPVYAMIQKGSGEFEILSGDEIIVSGVIKVPEASDKFLLNVSEITPTEETLQLTGSDIYSEFLHRGYKYSGPFKAIKTLKLTEEGSISTSRWNNNWSIFLETMIQQYLFQKGERNQNTLTPSAIQRVALSLPLLPTTPEDIEVTYNYSTNIISTKGIQISGINACPMPLDRKPISYDSVEFIPFNNNVYKSIELGINLGLQIVIQNSEDDIINTISIVEIETKNSSLSENIKNVVNKQSHINMNISSVKNPKSIMIAQTDPLFIIANDTMTKDMVQLLTYSNAVLMVQTDKSILSHSEITHIAQFSVDNINYSIVRKSSNRIPIIINIKADTLSAKDLSRGNLAWVTELRAAVASIKPNQTIYLVSSMTPIEGINNFTQEMKSVAEMKNVRYVFMLDSKVPEFRASEPFYKDIFRQELYTSVFKDGYFGAYLSIPVDFKSDVVNSLQTTSNAIANKHIDYIGINLLDETLTSKATKVQLGNIDYSGFLSTGENVMGLARFDLDTYEFIPDSKLQWNVPDEWSLEDAATIPHAYSTAYVSLMVKAKLKPGETVLIHAGCSAIGLAAISIASTHGCTVYTTVATDWQKAFLKKRFACLRDRNILSSQNTTFEPQFLLATGGVGAHVILNCLSGNLLHASLRCVSEFGRFIQLGKLDLEENNSIGMNIFLRNTSFFGVCPENIFDALPEDKARIHDLIEQGIKNFIVRPLDRKVVEHQDIGGILRSLKDSSNIGKIIIKLSDNLALNKLNVNKTEQFICNSKCSYLVYGGNSEMWTDMAEWLVLRGARKIIISSESRPQQAHINRRLSLLQTYFNAEIIFAPSKAQTRDSATELLSEVYFLGPIRAVFVLPNKNHVSKTSDIKHIHYLETALRTTAPKALFINFLNTAVGMCQNRADTGFATYNVQWQSILEFSDALNGLDEILTLNVKSIMVKSDRSSDVDQETTQALFKKLALLLPNSQNELKSQAMAMPKKPDFIQLPSLCPRNAREIPPLFIIPGIAAQQVVKEFADNLLYPIFCAKLPPAGQSIKQIAIQLADRMKELYKRGPYNIIGISWGGILAIEISRILETRGQTTQLYLIDAAPDTIQATIKHLGEGVTNEISLLTRFLNINNPETVKGLSALPSWESRLKIALESSDIAMKDRMSFECALTTLKDRTEAATNFQPTDQLILGQTCLLRPTGSSKYDSCGLLKYCKQTAEISVINGDHISILKNKETADIINEKVIC